MKFIEFSTALILAASFASAGPIQREKDVVRHANSPQKRYVANYITTVTFGLPQRRAPTEPASSIISSTPSNNQVASPSRKGTEDGSVPAVGVGGDNTSLLSLLTQTSTNEAVETNTAVDSTQTTEQSSATFSGTTDVASTTATTLPFSNSSSTTTTDAPVAAQASAQATDTSSDVGAQDGSSTSILPIVTGSNTTTSNPASEGISSPTATTVDISTTIQVTINTTVVGTPSTTDPVSQSTNDASITNGANTFSITTSSVQEPQQSAGTTVFVTESPTFTGPIGGYTTLTDGSNESATESTSESSPTTVEASRLSNSASDTITFTSLQGTATGNAATGSVVSPPSLSTADASSAVTDSATIQSESASTVTEHSTTTILVTLPAQSAITTTTTTSSSSATISPPPVASATPAASGNPSSSSDDGGVSVIPVTLTAANLQNQITVTQTVTTTVTAR